MYFGQRPSQVPEKRWLAYHYTELSRGNYFGQWTPITPGYQRRDPLNTTIHNLAGKPTLADGPPKYKSRNDLHPTTQKLEDEPTLANGSPKYKSRKDLHTTTQNMEDEPNLVNGPLRTRAKITCIQIHKTWVPDEPWVADETTLAFGNPKYKSKDDLHTHIIA